MPGCSTASNLEGAQISPAPQEVTQSPEMTVFSDPVLPDPVQFESLEAALGNDVEASDLFANLDPDELAVLESMLKKMLAENTAPRQ